MLGLPPSFSLDSAELERRYLAAQREFHPDRLVGKPDAVRREGIARSMQASEAYGVLKDPLKRARHLLALANISGEENNPSLLMEVMELREALSELETADAVQTFGQKIHTDTERTINQLSEAFAASNMSTAETLCTRLSYLTRIGEEVRVLMVRMAKTAAD